MLAPVRREDQEKNPCIDSSVRLRLYGAICKIRRLKISACKFRLLRSQCALWWQERALGVGIEKGNYEFYKYGGGAFPQRELFVVTRYSFIFK